VRPVPLVLLALCACTPVLPPDRTSAPETLRVATWNVHDLFDAEDRLFPPGAADDVLTPAEVDAKLVALAATLRHAAADAVLLQEVENTAVLSRLAAAAGYPHALLAERDDPRGIDVALLSRLPVLGWTSHLGPPGPDGRPVLGPRGCLEATLVTPAGRTLTVLSCHLASPVSDPAGARRAAQAAALRALADATVDREAGSPVVAGGDLNAEPGAPELSPLLGDGAWADPTAALAASDAVTWPGPPSRRIDLLLVPRALAENARPLPARHAPGTSDHALAAIELHLP
jgi:endonuclease/exonuclease/phosphatase family metal-dependent hydrolase